MNASDDQKRKWREDKQRYRTGRREVHLSFSLEEARKLDAKAKEHKKQLPEYIKHLLTHNDKTPSSLTLSDDAAQALVLGIRRIGTNINQCVRHINASGTITHHDLGYLRNQLNLLEALVADSVVSHQTIEPLLRSYLMRFPNRQTHLIRLIETHHDYKTDTR